MYTASNLGKAALFLGIASLTYACGSGDKNDADKNNEKTKKEVADAAFHKKDKIQKSTGEGKLDEADKGKHVSKAFCVVNAKSDSEVVGAVTFTEVEGGVRIIADIGGLTPGKHGFHIHEHGDCSAPDATSAGGHFNPTKKKHGGPDSAERHVGDLGNIEANDQGLAHYDRVDNVISLNGKESIIGKSIIIHSDPDDLVSDPTGNAGKRLACGEIVESEM
jgi:Cu-Zn family superoxide dismutase